jgi:hypothetical protein
LCIHAERNTPFCYAYFIYIYIYIYIYITTVVFNERQLPTLLHHRVHSVAQGRKRKIFQVSKESSVVCSYNYRTDVYDHLFIRYTTHICCKIEFIKLTLVWSLNVVSCIIIRVAGFFFCIVCDKFRTEFLIKHALSTLSVNFLGLNVY